MAVRRRVVALLLCDVHARELGNDSRLSDVVWFYDATVEDNQPAA